MPPAAATVGAQRGARPLYLCLCRVSRGSVLTQGLCSSVLCYLPQLSLGRSEVCACLCLF
jgi:hypothetical protein